MFWIFLHPVGCHIAFSRWRVVLGNDCTYDICCTLFVFCPLRALIGSIKTLVRHQSDICTLRAEDSRSPQGSIMTSLRVRISNAFVGAIKNLEFVYRQCEKGENVHRSHESLEYRRHSTGVLVTQFLKRVSQRDFKFSQLCWWRFEVCGMWRRACCLDSDVSNDGGVFISKSEQTKKDLPCCFVGVAS